jgi:hypothetical protein
VLAVVLRLRPSRRKYAPDHYKERNIIERFFDKLSGRTVSINICEKFHSVFKRGITGVYHSRRALAPLSS